MAKKAISRGDLSDFVGGSKPAPVRRQTELPGTELAAMAEKQEGLLERVMGTRGRVDPESAKSDLAALHGVLTGLSQKTVVVIFAMGKILTAMKDSLPHGEFLPWLEANCSFTRMSAHRYMQVYDRYRDEPRRALAELSITEAYVEAGVKKIAAPEPEEEIRERGEREYDVSAWRDWKRVFDAPPISGVTLKRHRVVPYEDGRLYVVREETGPIPAVELLADCSVPEPAYQSAIQEVHQNLQMALEIFYAKVEEFEDKGIIARPFDGSRPAVAARMRTVTPDTQTKPTPRGKKPAKAGKRGA